MARRSDSWVLLLIVFGILWAGQAFGLNFVQFDRSFGGKGSGGGGFSSEIRLAFDRDDNIYVSDRASRTIQKLSPTGEFLWQYPARDADLAALPVLLVNPGDIAVDTAGNVYVADTTVVQIPRNDAANSDATLLYMYTPCVHVFDSAGQFIKTIPIDAPTSLPPYPAIPVKQIVDADGRFALAVQPSGYDRAVMLDVDAQGNLFVLDAERASRQSIAKYSPTGERVTAFGRYGAGDGEFDSPKDLAVATDGSVFVADTGNHRIVQFDNDGNFVRAFARRGYGANEVTSPHYIAATFSNEIIVKDDATYIRRRLLPGSLYSLAGLEFGPQATSGAARLIPGPDAASAPRRFGRTPIDTSGATAPTDAQVLSLRLRLLESLLLLDKQEEGDESLQDPALKQAVRVQNTLYHKVIHRVLRYDVNGRYLGDATYRLDQLDEKLKDLTFVGADPFGNIYLQDGSDFTIRRYRIVGFSLRLGQVDALSASSVENRTNDFTEDYEDIDEVPDTTQDETVLNARQRFLFNYDVTSRWNLTIDSLTTLANRDGNQDYPEKRENGITFEERNTDSDVLANLRRVLNPNPYRYREVNLFFERADGRSRIDTDPLRPNLNRQAGRQEGTSATTRAGISWDVFRNMNVEMTYSVFNPIDTSRNYTRQFFDLEGNLYEVLRAANKSKVLRGEMNIKF